MKNSQLEMINRLENNIKHAELKTVIDDDSTVCLINDIDMAVSLIKEQQEKIAKYEKIYKEYDCYRWVKELNKKDKQIDLMAKKINEAYCDETSFYNWFEKTFGIRAEGDYSKEIKQYFADLIEKE